MDLNTKQTIAVIGEVSREVYSICKNLSRGHDRLIFCGDEKQNMEAVAAKIKSKILKAEVEVQDCIIDASWEADIIIVAAAEGLKEIAECIREVANQKVVIITGSDSTHDEGSQISTGLMMIEDLQQLLPHSKLVRLSFAKRDADAENEGGRNNVTAFIIESDHKAGLCAVADLLKEAGCNVIIKDDSSGPREARALAIEQ